MMEARLVLTDALISESLRRSKRGDKLEERTAPRKQADAHGRHTNTSNVAAAPEQDRARDQRKGD